jgi:hypothetical protein
MEIKYIVIRANSAHELSNKVNRMIGEGYKTVGSHKVVVTHTEIQRAGTYHKNHVEYSQTMEFTEEL